MQKTLIGIFIIVTFTLLGLSFVNQKRNDTYIASEIKDNSNTTISANNVGRNLIKGFNLISDKKFQDRLLKYMHLMKEQNYKEIYKHFLSTNYLNKYYCDVTNADEYEGSRGSLELITVEYLEILGFKILDAKKYQWASPDKLDTKLSTFSLIFKVFRGHTSNRRMTAVPIVINLNKLKDFTFSLNS